MYRWRYGRSTVLVQGRRELPACLTWVPASQPSPPVGLGLDDSSQALSNTVAVINVHRGTYPNIASAFWAPIEPWTYGVISTSCQSAQRRASSSPNSPATAARRLVTHENDRPPQSCEFLSFLFGESTSFDQHDVDFLSSQQYANRLRNHTHNPEPSMSPSFGSHGAWARALVYRV